LSIEYIWFFVMPIVGMILLFVFPFTVFLLYFKFFNRTTRKLNSFIRKKMVIILEAYDSGRVYLRGLRERKGVAIGRTDDGSYRLLPKHRVNEDDTRKKNKAVDSTEQLLTSAVSKRFFLENTGCPLFLGHGGNLCITNPETLAIVESADGKPKKIKGSKGKKLILLDPRKLETLIPKNYDESQLNAIINDIWAIIRADSGFGRFLIPIIMLAVLAVGAVIVLKFMGGM